MPNGPMWINSLNEHFGHKHIDAVNPDDIPGADVPAAEAIGAFGVRGHDSIDPVLASMPSSHVAALRGLLQDAAARNVPVNFAWMPGYEHEVAISEWGHEGQPCGITVVLRGPHRADIAARTAK